MSWTAAMFSRQPEKFRQVYSDEVLKRVRNKTSLFPRLITPDNFQQHQDQLRHVDVIFSTWGMFPLTEEQLNALPALKIVFYAAGATDYFAAPFISRGVRIVSAWKANAIPVAEFCLAQI